MPAQSLKMLIGFINISSKQVLNAAPTALSKSSAFSSQGGNFFFEADEFCQFLFRWK